MMWHFDTLVLFFVALCWWYFWYLVYLVKLATFQMCILKLWRGGGGRKSTKS